MVKKFAYTLHKQASLNHLTQAARAVLSNSYQVRQILIDWERLDFELIKEQASWVCQCKEGIFESSKSFSLFFFSTKFTNFLFLIT